MTTVDLGCLLAASEAAPTAPGPLAAPVADVSVAFDPQPEPPGHP